MGHVHDALKQAAHLAGQGRGPDLSDPDIAELFLLLAQKDGVGAGPAKTEPEPMSEADERKMALGYLRKKILELRQSRTEGDRNNTLNAVAFAAGRVVEGGFIEHERAWDMLIEAAFETGLPEGEIKDTSHSGYKRGLAAGWSR